MNFRILVYFISLILFVGAVPKFEKLILRRNDITQLEYMNENECKRVLNTKQSDQFICNMYHSCLNGVYKVLLCPEGYLFSDETQKCETKRKVNCGTRLALDFDQNIEYSNYLKLDIINGSLECPLGFDGYYADPEFCNIYHHCIAGIDYVDQCMHQLVWNDRKKMCDWQTNVNCSGKQIPVAYGETSFCTDQIDGKYKHLEYCNVFHHCVGGIDNVVRCDGELQWNDKIKQCDWESVVKCAGKNFYLSFNENNHLIFIVII
jgi:hypothetical protein